MVILHFCNLFVNMNSAVCEYHELRFVPFANKYNPNTACPRCLGPFYVEPYYINRVKTSWTYVWVRIIRLYSFLSKPTTDGGKPRLGLIIILPLSFHGWPEPPFIPSLPWAYTIYITYMIQSAIICIVLMFTWICSTILLEIFWIK